MLLADDDVADVDDDADEIAKLVEMHTIPLKVKYVCMLPASR